MKSHAKLVHSQSGFSALEVVLIIVVVGVIAGAGWFVWHAKQTSSGQSSKQSSSQTSQSSNDTENSSDLGESSAAYLTVSEWGVKIPLSETTKNVSYTVVDGTHATISVASLNTGCSDSKAASTVGELYRAKSESDLASGQGVLANGYYYDFYLPQGACSTDSKYAADTKTASDVGMKFDTEAASITKAD